MIEVYAVELPEKMNPELFNLLLNSASPVKRQRIERFVRETDKLSGLFSDLLIRSIIMGKTGLKNSQISFGQNEYGKPYLIGVDDFHFNISHAGVWVVAAVDSAPVGIDVEKMLDVEIGLSNHYFTEDEHSDLMSHHDRKSYFFTLWSLKESYVKNLG
ncbi:MAG: 4'-phosphopantetheinyl transferase superfamily protein, partial [bacterium]|nr:4'-phosphopantetheinyl transferase superfamily protein [bacterium]